MKKLLNTVLSLLIATAPLSDAMAASYYFRKTKELIGPASGSVETRTLSLGARTFGVTKRLTAFSFDFKSLVTASSNISKSEVNLALAGTLPTGLSFSNGVLSGAPSASGQFAFSINATYAKDGFNLSDSKSFSLTVIDAVEAIELSSAAIPAGDKGISYSFDFGNRLTLEGIVRQNVNFAVDGALPAGLGFGNGILSGVPTQAGIYPISITASNSGGTVSSTKSYSLQIKGGAGVSLASAAILATEGVPSSFDFKSVTTVQDVDLSAITYLVSPSTPLPAGLVLSSAGVLSGTPTAAGFATITVTAVATSNGTEVSSSKSYVVQVQGGAALALASAALPNTGTGRSYSYALSALVQVQGGVNAADVTYGVTGELPPGLALSAGVISGTPTASGKYDFTISASEAAHGLSASRTYSISVNSIYLVTSALPTVGYGTPVSFDFKSVTLADNFDNSSISYNVVWTGRVPAGATFENGVLAGSPLEAGTYPMRVTATLGGVGSVSAQQDYQLLVTGDAEMVIASATFAPIIYGSRPIGVNPTLSVKKNLQGAAVTWSASGLPSGLIMTNGDGQGSYGVISGAATATGTFNFTVTASALVAGQTVTASKGFTLEVNRLSFSQREINPQFVKNASMSPIDLKSLLQTSGNINVASLVWSTPYLTAEYSGSPYRMPAGIAVSSTGVISGTPTSAPGGYQFVVQVDYPAKGLTAAIDVFYEIQEPSSLTLAAADMPITGQNRPFNFDFKTVTTAIDLYGGSIGYTVDWGTLPPGMTLGEDGVLSGSPTAGGHYSFSVKATLTDEHQAVSDTTTYSIWVYSVDLTTASLPNASTGVAYTQSLKPFTTIAVGDKSMLSYEFALEAGDVVPPGITMNADGIIAGTPTAGGTYSFHVKTTFAANGYSVSDTEMQTLTVVSAPKVDLVAATMPNASLGGAVSFDMATATTAQYLDGNAVSYSIVSGSLPAGVSMDAAGKITGNPTVGGVHSFSVKANVTVNGTTVSDTQAYTLNVYSVALASATPPSVEIGTAYGYDFAQLASVGIGSTASVSYAALVDQAGEALPTGLTLSAQGLLTGTATAGGTFNFRIRASYNGVVTTTATKAYSVTVVATPTMSLAANTFTTNAVGFATPFDMNVLLTKTNTGASPVTWSLTSGAVPTGMALATSGVISGTASAGGTFTFTAKAEATVNGHVYSATRTYTYPIASLTLAATSTINVTRSSAMGAFNFSSLMTGNNIGTPTYAALYDQSGEAWPTGLTLSSAGTLSGTPTVAGNYSFRVKSTYTSGSLTVSSTQSYVVAVLNPTITMTSGTKTVGVAVGMEVPYNVMDDTTVGDTGGVAPTFTVTSGTLPNGLSLSSAGIISGSPTTAGNVSVGIRASVTVGGVTKTATKSYSFAVMLMSVLGSDQNFYLGVAASGSTVTTGNITTSNIVMTVLTDGPGESLPPGVTINTSRNYSGKPTAAGTYRYRVQASYTGNGVTIVDTKSITTVVIGDYFICDAVASTYGWTRGNDFTQNAVTWHKFRTGSSTDSNKYAQGGTYVFNGTLPVGVNFSSSGMFSGNVAASNGVASFPYTITGTVNGVTCVSAGQINTL